MFIEEQKKLIERQKELAERKKELAKREAEHQKGLIERKKIIAQSQEELAGLERAYQQGNFQLFVVYGPEGSGKTMLLQEFCDLKRRIFFKTSGKDATTLQNFIERVLFHYDKPQVKFLTDWGSVFKYIADNEGSKNKMDKRLVLVLNEFPDPIRRNDQFMKMLKDSIDNYLSQTEIFLIIINSDIEFVQKYFLDENAILH